MWSSAERSVDEKAPRVLPVAEGPASFFWTSGSDGILRFLGCNACGYLIHPPVDLCPRCLGRDTTPVPTSGRGTVYSFTVNHQPWDGVGDAYVIALVELDDQPGLRLMTNIVEIEPGEVRVGMPVEVVFEDHAPIFLPMFRVRP
jgi:uncharacterized protein